MRKMKDSGVEWIGVIPEAWCVYRNKNAFVCSKELVGEKSSVTQLLSLTTKGIKEKDINNAEGKLPETFDTYQKVNKNDLVMCLFDLDVSAVFSGISMYSGMISPAYKVLSCTGRTLPRYADYWFQYISHGRKFNHYAKNIRYTLNIDEFMSLPMIFPSMDEQGKIADYLDSKCAKIDSIIAKQEQIIEKLKKYKLSLITEAVTKGLDPNVEMKDSGVEWIGEIPAEWCLCRVKNLYQKVKNPVKVGPFGSQLTTSDYVSEGVWVYNQRVVLDKEFSENDTFISEEKYEEMKGFAVEEGDVLITTRGTGTTGHVVKVPKKYYKGILHPCLMRIKLDEDKCLFEFLYYVFEYGSYIRKQIDFANNTSSLPVLYSYTLNNLSFALPSISEQHRIVNQLDIYVKRVDRSILQKKALIDQLKEYKKSLIYEVVTGKKEV